MSASTISHQQIPAINIYDIENQIPPNEERDYRNAEIRIPAIYDIENQIPPNEERDYRNAEIRRLGEEISGIMDKYAKKTNVWNLLLSTCGAWDGGVLAAVWSGQNRKDPLGCASATCTLILSGIVSASFIFAFAYVFFLQFRMLKRAEQMEEERDSIVEGVLPTATSPRKRTFCRTYKKKVLETTYATWWLPRALFLAVLTAISACLLVSCARLLC